VALEGLPEDQRLVYWAIIERALGEAARKAFEMLPETQRFMSESQRRSFAKGEAKGKAEAVLQILATRGLAVTESARERILGCSELETLVRWLDRALTVTASDQLFE
jgi:hypothetical protein